MGRSAKRKDSKEAEKKRKRRKKARTDVSSDSDSSSSSEDEVKVSKAATKIDVEMDDAPAASALPVPEMIEDDEFDHENAGAEGSVTGKPNEKGGQIPVELCNLHDSQAEAKFDEYYMRLVTEEFGDDLNNLRNAKDFGDKSLPMLVRALRQGINIFSADDKKTIVKELA